MSNPGSPGTTSGGLVGQIVGKAKTAIGSLLGKEDLEREGNLQLAQAEAEVIAAREKNAADLQRREAAVDEQRAGAAAERDRLRIELEAEELRQRIEETEGRRENEIARLADQKQAAIRRRDDRRQRRMARRH